MKRTTIFFYLFFCIYFSNAQVKHVTGQTTLINPYGRTLMIERDDEDSYLTFHDPLNKWFSMGLDNSNGTFSLNYGGTINSTQFVMSTTGNIGMGVTLPTSKLHVKGDLRLEPIRMGDGKYAAHLNWGGHTIIMGSRVGDYAHNEVVLRPGGANQGPLNMSLNMFQALGPNDYERRIQINTERSQPTYFNAGNFGIGLTNPDEKLTVKGNIHAREVRVDLDGVLAADYVFKDEYKLNSLEEVEKYILENGHLPNIPSGEDMEYYGIKLKEMNMKLLEKVEELTLYTLQQEKHINSLEIRLNKVDKSIGALLVKSMISKDE